MEDSEKADSDPIPSSDEASSSQGKSCALCGCATPAVRCDRCNSQIFCLSCDDMYHRHPKRKQHLRKAVESIWSSARSPRFRRRTDLPGDPCKIPIPPPRTKKRERHTIGGRMFLKSGLELGSFGHSKQHLHTSKDIFPGQKSPASLVESNCDDETLNQNARNEPGQIYENDNVNPDDRSPWNTRPNISSPIQVSIPSNSPDIVTNGQSFGYPTKPHSQSAADLTGHAGHPIGHHPYHFHPPYPYMHPSMHPYSHSMAHLNCAQCISSSWSNLMSPHPSPYFHPMPWGSAQNTMSRGSHIPGHPAPMKHSHGDLVSYPDSNFHYPYPGGGYYPNGPPAVDPNFIKDLHEQAEMQRQKKETTDSKPSTTYEEMDANPGPVENEPSSSSDVVPPTEANASANQDVQEMEKAPEAPIKPTEPWSCVHCTFINPPGIHICQVCCKTSYGNKQPKSEDDESEMRPMSRDSESPLVNRDALLNTPEMSGFKEAQKDVSLQEETQIPESESRDQSISRTSNISEGSIKLTTETQTSTTTKTTDVQTQNILLKSIASSTDSIFPKQDLSVQTETEKAPQNCSVATDPMISSQSLESLLSGVSAPPYHNRRAGWGRGASLSTQSLYERGRSRSPMPRSLSSTMYNEGQNLGRNSNFASEEAMHSISQAWLYTDPMYYKPHNQDAGHPLTKEDYFDGTWGSMDRLNHRVKSKKDKGKLEHMRPKFHRSLDDLKSEKRPEIVHTQELMMLQTVKEAERCGFTLEDLHVAYLNCGKENPVYWLEDNWSSMIKNVIALAAKYGEDNEENDVGVISATEAKDALRIHRGDIWDAVTECIENRQRKILELTVRGNFTQKQIADALKHNEGNVELAYADLLRASTRRHKFILSPGLSEDSDVYNPVEDTSGDHRVSLSPMKAPKLDVSTDSKSEKKKSDFFTKLTAIRQAQSERRKAREEKELIRESITQDYPDSLENEIVLKENAPISASISREDSKEVEEILQDNVSLSEIPVEISVKSEEEIPAVKSVPNIKEGTEDTIPVDFDTNWSESQGEWIEEYSDEQWEEGDEHWVGLGKKFQKMQKEFEEEARQMASLWEKEELEDDVFEEDAKVQQEAEVTADSDKKFDDWVKANLSKVDSSEYEEEEMKIKPIVEDISTSISLKDRIEIEVSGSSPLQHYPTEHDLSLKSQFESDWVDLPADEEIEKLAHDIVCEGSDIENKFDEDEVVSYEGESRPMKLSDQGSDEDWEKIEMDEQLQEVNELDNFAFPEKEAEIDKSVEEVNLDIMEREITIDNDSKVLYKNFEFKTSAVIPDLKEVIDSTEDKNLMSDIKTDQPILEGDAPLPPVRRKSRLSSTSIQQALENQAASQASSDIPPALPEKAKRKQLQQQQQVSDIYSLPDKSTKLIQPEEGFILKEVEVPPKPPRLNLSPVLTAESSLQQSREDENEPKVPPKTLLSTTGSPLSLSYESDSNCFADSESDTEIKLQRQKNKLRKLPKYENEIEDTEMEVDILPKQRSPSEENEDILESNFDMELDDDIDPSLIEPLPRFKDADYDPELPIMLAGRGGRISDLEDMDAPKAFREDTTRPLQLFKVVKKETPTNTLSRTSPVDAEQLELEDSIISRTHEGIPLSFPTEIVPISKEDSNVQVLPSEMLPKLPVTSVYENNSAEMFYYNEATSPKQNLVANQVLDNQKTFDAVETIEKLSNQVEMEHELQQDVQLAAPAKEENDEMGFTEMESLSAVADYFFGRYNEITVTRPKKKTPIRAKPPVSDKSANAMSTSDIAPAPKTETPSEMEQSAAAVLQAKPHSELDISTSDIQMSNQVVPKPPVSKGVYFTEKPKEPIQSEPLPFAEDYLFGCYNQVVVPTKTRNKPVLTPIPKLGESLRTRSLQKEEKSSPSTPEPTPAASPEPPELPSEEPVDQVSEDEENAITAETSSIYDENFYEFPPEMLSNQSFDESSIYESFQDAVEDVQSSSVITSSVVNVRPKSVHFEEPQAPPVVPPRRNKTQTKTSAYPGTNESYADEYLYRQYEQVTQSTQAKKKLPECSQDFRMQQGFEPTEFPCDTPLKPGEQEDDVMSSEISVEILEKSTESLKYTPEYEFESSEQVLDSIQQDVNIEKLVTGRNEMLLSESNSVSGKISTEAEQDSVLGTDFQSCRNVESFEELFIPDQGEEIIEDSLVSKDLISKQESRIVSGDLSHSSTDSSMNKPSNISDIKPDELSIVPNTLEIDEFVMIEPTHDIIDDAYNLYDIQESLVCDLNYIDVKGNIEDECTDDSEKEWKRNEDRKNYLNATFLKSGSSKEFTEGLRESSLSEHKELTEEQMESSLREQEKCNLEEHTEDLSSSDKFKTAEFTEIQEDADRNLKNLDLENIKGTSLAKDIETAIIDDEQLTAETLDSKPLTDISEALIDEDFESKDSLIKEDEQVKHTSEVDEISEKIAIENETSLQIVEKIVENICEEKVELNDIEAVESITKKITEFSEDVISEHLTEEIIDSINEDDISESISQEVTALDLAKSDLESHLELASQKAAVKFNAEAELLEAGITDESLEVSENQQIDILEELEASGDLSDDNVSTHSSVSTQIAVSMETGTKEVEGDEFSLIFEQMENLGSDYDTFAGTSLSSAVISDEFQVLEKISSQTSEHDSFEKIEQMIETAAQKLEDFEYEYGCKLDFDVNDTYELSSSSPALRESESKEFYSQINLEESVSEADVSESNDISLKKFIFNEEEFEAEIISEERSDAIENKEAVKLIENSLYSGNGLPVNILPDVKDTESNEPKTIDSKSLMEEESLQIMSHFYDDMYQNVQYPSFTLLSAESLYAKYGTNESSESGSESDVDNIMHNLSEDIPQHSEKGNVIDVKFDQSEKDIQKLDSPVETSVQRDFDEMELLDDVDTQSSFKTEFMHVTETVCQSDSTNELCPENKIQQDQEISKGKYFEGTEISSVFPEETKMVTVLSKSKDFMQSVKDQECSEVKSVESKFSTSKSCQTEDSFEEDIFFDSFDDTFTIPSFIQLPIENQVKPETSEVSIQCELISIEDILSSQKLISSVTQTIASETQAVSSTEDSTAKLRDSAKKEIPLEEKEDSSCESFEDSDSDIFIDSPSSHDELEIGTKKGYLYAEVDSDTGFSSGSEYGWTKKSSLKQKDLKKTSIATESQSQQIATSIVTTKKVIFDSTQSHLKESTQEESFSTEGESVKAYISGESKASEQSKAECDLESFEVSQSAESPSSIPIEIIERAITPVAIPITPSFEEDLVFVEIEDRTEDAEVLDEIQEAVISTTPTVEYFYGPLPETVTIESLPDSSDKFFETASELPESMSLTYNETESFSYSDSSVPFSGERTSFPDTDVIEELASSNELREESLNECSVVLKGEIEDSISEYYPLSDSSSSLLPKESDIFDFAQSKVSDISIKESSDVKKENLSDFACTSEDLPTAVKNSLQSDDIETFVKIQYEVEICNKITSFESSEKLSEDKCDEFRESSQLLHSEHHDPATDLKFTEISSRDELVISQVREFSDVPPVPSDIVRYLYYDDSITFDDDSYHTQSENVEIPLLSTEETKPVNSDENVTVEANQNVQLIVAFDEKSAAQKESCILPSQSISHAEAIPIVESLHITASEADLSNELCQKSSEILVEQIQDIQPSMLEPSASVDTIPFAVSEATILTDDIEVPISGEVLKTNLSFTKGDINTSEADLKFPTVEVIVAENVTDLPDTAEQLQEPIVHLNEHVLEPITAAEILPCDGQTLTEIIDSDSVEPTILRQISSDVPPVPSDIVRYLYYGDDITFDETTQSSSHSQLDSYNASDQPQIDVLEICEDLDIEPELKQEADVQCLKYSEYVSELSADSSQELSPIPDSSEGIDLTPPHDSSEYWFDIDEDKSTPSTNGKKEKQDSDQHSSTKSSAFKDSEEPCIPEYILSPLQNDLPIGKTDIDEVTDISTHFTMTDDSDRFSDIESDTSLNFEEECIYPHGVSHLIDEDDLKDEQMFESISDEEEIIPRTPEVKEIPGGFQFVPVEPLRDELIESFLPEDLPVKSDQCIASTEISEQHSKEQFAECIISSELLEHQSNEKIMQEHLEALKEKTDECITSSEFLEHSKEHFSECLTSNELPDKESDKIVLQEILKEDPKKRVDECVTSFEFSEHFKEQFAECVTSSAFIDKESEMSVIKESLEEPKEKLEEISVSTRTSELSKEDFAECLTSNELLDKESEIKISQECLKEKQKEKLEEIVISTEFLEVTKEEFTECVTSSAFIDKESEIMIIKESLGEELKEKLEEHSVLTRISELPKEDFAECLTSNEFFDKESEIKISQECLKEEQKEKLEEIVISTEFSEATKEEFTECLTTSKLLDQQPVEETLLDSISDYSFKELTEKATTSEVQLSLEDENGNFPELMSQEQEYVCTSTDSEVLLNSDDQQKVAVLEAAINLTEKIDEMDISCYMVAEEESHSNECLFVAAEAADSNISLEKPESSIEAETTFVDKVDDVDVSSKSADENSHSISVEITDNWFDADGKHIEADESVYELPSEDSNQSHLEINIVHESEEKIVNASFTEHALLDSSEVKVIETKKTDSTILKAQKENINIQSSEVFQDQDLQNNELHVDVMLTEQTDKIATDAECEKAEVSVADDSLHTCEISETKEISIYQDIISETIDIAVDKQHDTLTQINAPEQDSKQSSLGFLSPDIKNISDVKMGTESEISTTLKEEVNIELMSAVLDFEPTSSLDRALYDTQEVKSEAISHRELCLEEKLVADISSHSDFKDSSQGIIPIDAGMERCQIIDDADIFESSPLSIIKIKDVEIAKAESKDEYESNLKISSLTDYGILPMLPDKIEESETLQVKEENVMADTEEKGIVKCAVLDVLQKSNENVNQDIQKLSEETGIVDFKGEITKAYFKEENLASKADSQIVKFVSQTPQDEISTEAKEEYVDFKGQFEVKENQKCVMTELSSKSEVQISDVYLKEEGIANLTEIVDFKGGIVMDKDEISIPVVTSIAKVDEKDFIVMKKDKIFSGTDSLEKVDFKGEFIITDDTVNFKNLEALSIDESVKKAPTINDKIVQVEADTQLFETVDFKGQPVIGSFMIEEECVDFKSMDTVKSKPHGDQLEMVDFKSHFTISEEISEMKEQVSTSTKETTHSTNKIKTHSKKNEARQSLEIVDFKGQLFNTDLIELESQKESTADFVEKKMQDVPKYNIPLKTEDKLETVDFKGEFTPGTYDVALQIEDKKDFASIKDFKSGITNESITDIKKDEPEKMDIQIKSEIDSIFETVDFKGDLAVQQVEEKTPQKNIDVDLKTEVSAEKPKTKNVIEMTDSKESINSSYTVVAEQKKEPEVKQIDDISQVLNCAYNETSYDAGTTEMYEYDTYEEVPILGPQEMYEHNAYEQAITYDSPQMFDYISDQSVAFESQEPVFYDQTFTSGTVFYDMAESSDLYSCAETLSAAEDTSVQFYSLSDDLEDISNITASDDFTDVPSHLTESSDKWSDVEADFSFEDAELDRDKTPTRTLDEGIEGKVFEDITFDHQENAIKIRSTDEKDESLVVLDSKKDIRVISQTDQTIVQEVFELSSVGPKSENISEISTEAAFCESKESQIIEETDFTLKKTNIDDSSEPQKIVAEIFPPGETVTETKVIEQSARKIVESSEDVKEIIESSHGLKSKIQSIKEISDDSLEIEHVEQSVFMNENMFTAGKTDLKALDNIELLETKKSGDISVVSSAEDYFDVSTHQLTTEDSDKWSDVESEMEHFGKEFKICSTKEIKDSHAVISDFEIIDEIIPSDVANLILDESVEDNKVDSSSDEQLREHFADIKSLKDQLTTADTFTSLDVETAISKTHEDTSTDISSQFEKTESEYWLEAETERSVSEFGDEAVFSSEREEDRQFEISDMRIIEERVTAIPLSLMHSSETATTISTSSSYTDFESSDQTSDTCADQGATTENSDKWSDIEAEALIDDVLYGNLDIAETIEIPDFPPLIKQCEENRDAAEVPFLDSHLKTIQISSEIITETSATSIDEVKTETEEQEDNVCLDSKSELWKTSQSYSSFEGADSTSGNLTDSGQSSIPKESSLLSTPSNLTTSGMSGDEFTNVTPFEVINEESDKYSDISGDTSSVEEFEGESSVSLKADSKLLDYESDAIRSELKVDMSLKEVEDKSLKVNIEESSSLNDDQSSFTTSEPTKIPISESSEPVKNLISQTEIISECVKEETLLETIETKMVESIEAVHIDVEEKLEESVSSKITDESENQDNFTDVPTHTLTSETSEAYCELESDHSMEEIENQDVEIDTYLQGTQDITNLDSQNVYDHYDIQDITNLDAQNISGDYETAYDTEEQIEIIEGYNLDAIPEDELENYEEEYSLSEHFEINEDELIYPLPYNDWMEQSFELKEYGIEAAFSESGSDIHGLGIAYETYDDEDIQRAIDYNLSTFEENEENVENIVTTDSFKTMSNDASPHLKLSEKEFDTWSTADAPSIEEELEEQDNVLNKIDELLAEDFGLDTYPDSPLTDELSLEVEGYLHRDIATPDETCGDFTQLDHSGSPKDTLLQIDKGFKSTDSETIYTEVNSPVSLQTEKTFEISKVDEVPKKVTGKDFSISLQSNEESKVLESKTVSNEVTGKGSSEYLKLDKDLKEKFGIVSDKLCLKDSSFTDEKEILDADSISSKLSLTKDSSESLETSFSIRKEEKDVQTAQKSLEEIKISKRIEGDAKTDEEFRKSESETEKDLKTSKSESITSKLSLKDSSVPLQIDKKLDIADSVSSKVSLPKDLSQTLETSLTVSKEKDVKLTEEISEENKVSKTITGASKTDKEIEKSETEERDLKTLKSESVSSKLVLKDSSLALQTERKLETVDSDSVSSQVSSKDLSQTLETSFTVSKEKDAKPTEKISDEIEISKTVTCISKTDKEFKKSQSETEKDLKTSKSESVPSELSLKDSCALKTENKLETADSDSVSSKVSLPKDLSQTVETSFTVSKEKDAKLTEEIDEVKISKTISKTDKEFKKSDSEAVSMKICLKTDSKQEINEESDFSTSKESTKSTHKIQEVIKVSQISPSQSKSDFKSESETESNKVILEKDSAQILITESKSDSIALKKSVEKISEDTKVSKTITSVSKTDKELEMFEAEPTKISLKKDSEQTFKTDSETKSPEIVSPTSKALSEDTKTLIKQPETLVMVSEETNLHKVEETVPSREKITSDLSSKQLKKETELIQSIDLKSEQSSVVEGGTSVKLKSSKHISEKEAETSFKLTTTKELLSTTDDVSASVMLSSSKTSKEEVKDQKVESTTFSVSESDSSLDIPSKKLAKSLEASDMVSIKTKTSSELPETELLQSSQQLSESSKLSVVSAESVEVQSNIPIEQGRNDQTQVESISLMHTVKSKEQITADSIVAEVKPDIPKKTRQRSISSKEGTPVKEESDKKPSLPPKTSKRRSVSDSPSSSLGESLSSSSSVESLVSFESAASEKSKTSLKSSEEASMHSLSPEVPARRSRSKISSSSRSTSRDSDSSSAPSRSSSLKIRRRSSNFIEPEPIDLSKKRASIDERMLKLQRDGKCASREKAFIAAKLIEMQFEEEDALLASRQCNTVYHAVKFLTQLCEMCNCRFPINLMASMVHCAHKACKECLRAHFTSLIYDRSVFTLLCPICHTLDITDQNIQEYFIHLDMTLKNILEEKVYDLFQRKLRDEVLNKDPNFHWCSQCSSGFIASPRLKKLYCPDCSAITCALCHQTWELEHEGVHCERFQQWKDMHTPEPPPAGLVKYLTDRGISCPSCGILYQQACAGCLMYKCSHCSFEFCGFCSRPVKRGRDCSDKTCELRGLHIHHVHNCLFFLRDKDMTEIQILLEEESISYLTIPPKDQIVKSRCQVREQKNAHGILTEDRCGRNIEPYCAGLCRIHYYEYLAEVLRKNNISLLSIMTIQDLQFMLRKSRTIVPEKVKGETSEEYYERLINVITSTLT